MDTITSMMNIAIPAGAALIALIAIGLVVTRLYRRASKERAFVRTGLGGQKVVVNGGCMVFPVLHEIIGVNMNTLRLEVTRRERDALITADRMRVDVKAEFYVRVRPTEESIAAAAQTLGRKTMAPTELKELVEGKFVDGLRAAAAEMGMENLHEQRGEFVRAVQNAVTEDLLKNGLELESVSLTGLDQTRKEFFDTDNAFDAAGLTKLTANIEDKRRLRNEIERDTAVSIARKGSGKRVRAARNRSRARVRAPRARTRRRKREPRSRRRRSRLSEPPENWRRSKRESRLGERRATARSKPSRRSSKR